MDQLSTKEEVATLNSHVAKEAVEAESSRQASRHSGLFSRSTSEKELSAFYLSDIAAQQKSKSQSEGRTISSK